MKTPTQIIDEEFDSEDPTPETIVRALDAAGYVIVPKEISAPCPQLHAMFDIIDGETEGTSMEVYMSVRLAEALYKAAVNAKP